MFIWSKVAHIRLIYIYFRSITNQLQCLSNDFTKTKYRLRTCVAIDITLCHKSSIFFRTLWSMLNSIELWNHTSTEVIRWCSLIYAAFEFMSSQLVGLERCTLLFLVNMSILVMQHKLAFSAATLPTINIACDAVWFIFPGVGNWSHLACHLRDNLISSNANNPTHRSLHCGDILIGYTHFGYQSYDLPVLK